jgi:hypothetical protein
MRGVDNARHRSTGSVAGLLQKFNWSSLSQLARGDSSKSCAIIVSVVLLRWVPAQP